MESAAGGQTLCAHLLARKDLHVFLELIIRFVVSLHSTLEKKQKKLDCAMFSLFNVRILKYPGNLFSPARRQRQPDALYLTPAGFWLACHFAFCFSPFAGFGNVTGALIIFFAEANG